MLELKKGGDDKRGETVLYPNGTEVKSACVRLSSLTCEARPDKR
jgi:hypothetical protein